MRACSYTKCPIIIRVGRIQRESCTRRRKAFCVLNPNYPSNSVFHQNAEIGANPPISSFHILSRFFRGGGGRFCLISPGNSTLNSCNLAIVGSIWTNRPIVEWSRCVITTILSLNKSYSSYELLRLNHDDRFFSLYPMTTLFISHDNTIYIPWQHYLYPMTTLFISHDNTIYIPWQHYLYPMTTLFISHDNTIYIPWQHYLWYRLFSLYPMTTLFISHDNTIYIPWQHYLHITTTMPQGSIAILSFYLWDHLDQTTLNSDLASWSTWLNTNTLNFYADFSKSYFKLCGI